MSARKQNKRAPVPRVVESWVASHHTWSKADLPLAAAKIWFSQLIAFTAMQLSSTPETPYWFATAGTRIVDVAASTLKIWFA